MRKRAQQRLTEYQYYLAKAYEYAVLEPARVNFHNNRVFAELQKLFDIESDPAEVHNAAVENPEVAERMVARIWEIFDRGRTLRAVAGGRRRPCGPRAPGDGGSAGARPTPRWRRSSPTS